MQNPWLGVQTQRMDTSSESEARGGPSRRQLGSCRRSCLAPLSAGERSSRTDITPSAELAASEPTASHEPPVCFSQADRALCLALLNARVEGSAHVFDACAATEALEELENRARLYKNGNALDSLREVTRLLIAASGHDLPDIRTRANIALERVLAPKPYDAPLSARFVTTRVGETCSLSFKLAADGEFVLWLFPVCGDGEFPTDDEMCRESEPLSYDAGRGAWFATLRFESLGAVDFVVARRVQPNQDWVFEDGTSGRVNVLPDVRGEIILEVFTDVHGHTGLYWHDGSGHPGLVYNEHGQVIRIGTFADVAAHLLDFKERWSLTTLYLLGMQQRGSNREDWALGATSPSPFSPMSLCEPDARLGGAAGFRELVRAAHALEIKVVVDVIPHLNRHSTELSEDLTVRCYDERGQLVARASTDGRYGSWNDGKLLNYRKLAVWSWLADSIRRLILDFDIDGIRFDSAHAVPIMMQKHADFMVHGRRRSDEAMVEGDIVTNERAGDRFVTTGFYDCDASESLAVPLHTYLMRRVEQAVRKSGKHFFIHLAECFWGHERQLTRSGVIPYNSALFKVCEAVLHGRDDVRAIYDLYDRYLPTALPEGAVLLGILGNHDERRALDTFGARGLRAAVGLTLFMSEIVLDYEGNAEGESWRVFLDNINLDWSRAAGAAVRGSTEFYRTWYQLHRRYPESGQMIWSNNHQVAAALKRADDDLLVGLFNFSDETQMVSLQFDRPELPIVDEALYRLEDLVYSGVTGTYDYFTGRELRASKIHTTVSFADRTKLFKLTALAPNRANARLVFRASCLRMAELSGGHQFSTSYAFEELARRCLSPTQLLECLHEALALPLRDAHASQMQLAFKRVLYYLHEQSVLSSATIASLLEAAERHPSAATRQLARGCRLHHRPGTLVFLSAEVDPFSRSGGLSRVAHELPREMAEQGEDVVIITPRYTCGSDEEMGRMQDAIERHGVTYSGINVRFWLAGRLYEVGVHVGLLGRVRVFLLDHHELFDGLYWGITSEERLRRRIGFACAAAEVICTWSLRPIATFTNDAFAGLFNGIVRHDPRYRDHESFGRNSFMHLIHNGGWQYFDAYGRHEQGRDLFGLFDLSEEAIGAFTAPGDDSQLHCMAAGIRGADRVFTVSPSYAAHIERTCDGLEAILDGVVGISNGIASDFRARVDQRLAASGFVAAEWSRLREAFAEDSHLREKIAQRYPEILLGPDGCRRIASAPRRSTVVRMLRKLMLQCNRGLSIDPDKVLLVMIHRVAEQKGFQLLLGASPHLFGELGYQAVLGGAVAPGDARGEELAHGLLLLQHHFPKDVSVRIGFEDVAIPFLAADLVAMPSQSEPGGLVQLEAFACGALVIARATGGLRDTVQPIDVPGPDASGGGVGNGFLFEEYSVPAFAEAATRAARFLRSATEAQLLAARPHAERSVFHWQRAASQYIERVYADKELLHLPSSSASLAPCERRPAVSSVL